VDILFAWVEWRIEKLTPAEVSNRNAVMYAEVKVIQAKEKYDHWVQNEGVLLASKIAEKKRLQKQLSAKVVFLKFYSSKFFLGVKLFLLKHYIFLFLYV